MEGRRSASKVQCPRCGREVSNLVSGMCVQCLLETSPVVSTPKLHVRVCPHCLRYRDGDTWREGEADLESTLLRAAAKQLERLKLTERIEWGPEGRSPWRPEIKSISVSNPRLSRNRLTVDARIVFASEDEDEAVFIQPVLAVDTRQCRSCELRRSEFYECILQIRGDERKLEEDELEEVTRKIYQAASRPHRSPMAYISKVKDRKEGRDFYLGSAAWGRELARQLASETGGSLKESRKLVGQQRGSNKRLYKFTILLRLPRLRRGDVTEVEGSLHTVERIDGRKIVLRSPSGDEIRLESRKISELPLVARREQVEKAMVLEVRPDGIQILEPRRHTTVDLPKPSAEAKVGSYLNVIYTEDRVRVVSQSEEVDQAC